MKKSFVMYRGDLENADYGFSVHNGVIIVWDEDHDERILEFVDSLSQEVKQRLAMTYEHEGALELSWKDSVPRGFEVEQTVDVATDTWAIVTSNVI